MVPRRMGNVLDDQKQHDVRALGRLGWTLSRIAAETGVLSPNVQMRPVRNV
jgi:hypothetical protein